MAAKRTRSQANLDKKENARKQTKLSKSLTLQRSSSPNTSEDDEVAPPPAKKPKTRKPAAKKDPTPAKMYEDTLKEVDKAFAALMKRYKPNPTIWSGVTSDHFSAKMASFVPKAQKLAESSVIHAFNLVLDLGEHAYGDLEGCMKASGYGDTDKPFQKLDALLVSLINRRVALDKDADKDAVVAAAEPPETAYTVEPPHAEVSVGERAMRLRYKEKWKKRGPNKQQCIKLDRVRRDDLKDLFERRRNRREMAEDWAGNALNDLLETGGRIDQYGIGEHYFRESIGLLAEVKKIARPPLPSPPPELFEGEW